MKKKQAKPRAKKPGNVNNTPESHYTLQHRGLLKNLGLAGGTVIPGKFAWEAGADKIGFQGNWVCEPC